MASTTTTLITMPSELLLHIMRYLPAADDFVQFRSTCKQFSALVDEHVPVLVPPIMNRHYQRLREQIRLVDYAGLDLHTALQRHTAWTLAIQRPLFSEDVMSWFAKRYDRANPDLLYSIEDLVMLAWLIQPPGKAYVEEVFDGFMDLNDLNDTIPSIPEWDALGIFHADTHQSMWPAGMEFVPRDEEYCRWAWELCDYLDRVSTFNAATLGLPELKAGDELKYRIREFRVHNVLRDMGDSELEAKGLLFKARVLELVDVEPTL
ncbi:hypothetical protein LTR17_000837 [Elasticomyces elasticus]|nr:hypothetical protein LTR17_000837 [Elasticomyces elasticus]